MGSLHALPPAADAEPADWFDVDVLVIGASPAGVHAALAAAGQGLRVLVVERGQAVASATAAPGATSRARNLLWLAGHSALELLLTADGAVRGAAGISHSGRPDDAHERPWRATAGAVVMATGQGLLMAVEAGALLGGMDSERGGGLRVRCSHGATTVAGLFATGRAAWPGVEVGLPRHTPANALLGGQQAGLAAAAAARAAASRPHPQPLRPAGNIGLRGPGHHPISPHATGAALQAVLAPLPQSGTPAVAALRRLDALWQFLRSAAPAPVGALRATRDAVARLAEARWRLRSRMARGQGAGHARALVTGGLDDVWAETEASVWPLDVHDDDDDEVAYTAQPALTPPPQRLVAFAR